MAERKVTKKPAVKKPRKGNKPLPGFFSDYGGSGIVVDSMPGQKKKK